MAPRHDKAGFFPRNVDKDQCQKSSKSSIWDRAFERYRDELNENDDLKSVLDEGTMDDLVEFAQSTHFSAQSKHPAMAYMQYLGPTLRFLDDFAALLAFYCGADAAVTAFVWGSIRLMLTLCPHGAGTLQHILDMLEDISMTLPRFRRYEKSLPMDQGFESALLDVYTEMICFCARTIHFLRNNPHAILRQNAWSEREMDFERTVKRIKRFSSIVEQEADLARMRADKLRYGEVLDLVNDIRESRSNKKSGKYYTYLPRSLTKHFSGRTEELKSIHQALSSRSASSSSTQPRILALYGMGGVGKTQMALAYANVHRCFYDDVFWLTAENMTALSQGCSDVISKTAIVEAPVVKTKKDPQEAMFRFRNWLSQSDSNWLVILDNVDDYVVLRHFMPHTDKGSVIITTRDFNIARDFATASLQVKTLDNESGAELLLCLTGTDQLEKSNNETHDHDNACSIVAMLGGLPLALAQMGGFIAQRKLSLTDFLGLYKQNSTKILSRKVDLSEYEHTLSTVWEVSLQRLSGHSEILQNLLAFFDPDSIREYLLLEGSRMCDDGQYEFLSDDFDLQDAEAPLLQVALIEKSPQEKSLTIHRLVQDAVMRRLSAEKRKEYFDFVSRLLCWGFPDHWTEDQGHQIASWSRCETCLPHVQHLVKSAHEYNIIVDDCQRYAELLLRCSWYLYECESYAAARPLITSALNEFSLKNTNAYASALDLDGLLYLDLAQPRRALLRFEEALELRTQLFDTDHPFIAYSLNNLALAYTELGHEFMQEALEAHERAISIRLRNAPGRIGNSYSNLASLKLRMRLPDEAEKILKMCPSLKDFTDESFLTTGNPRFSGDMVLLSRIRIAQNRFDEALVLASKALGFRRQLLGAGLKTCDSLFDVAKLLIHQEKSAVAVELLREIVAIAETLPEADGHHARALCSLSKIAEQDGRSKEAYKLRAEAYKIRARVTSETHEHLNATNEDQAFDALCVWMLW